MKKQLSTFFRPQVLEAMAEKQYDLIVIGGGITGVGIALDAATRGLSCLLLEMQDFGAGTSSRSTKLIHGGLRYLKQLEVRLVREVGRERTILHQNASHLVVPRPMLLPIIEHGSLGKYSTSLGLFVYDLLAGVAPNEKRSMHETETILNMEPLLRIDIVEGGGLYYEYQTDDSRLVIEVLKTAVEYGADALNYAKVVDLVYENEKVVGVNFLDSLAKKRYSVRGKQIVNATGPWVDSLRKKDNSMNDKRLHLTKGVHIVVDYQRLPLQQAAYFDVPDGRMMFAIPKNDITYIGTTDTNFTKNPKRPQADLGDVNYILEGVNQVFPTVKLQLDDVRSSWAGVRPLIHQAGKSPSELSRKDEIFYAPSGLISIAGGKLTGFRKMAERTVDVVVKELYKKEKRPIKNCKTAKIKLSGGHFKQPDDISDYILQLTEEAIGTGLTEKEIEKLVYKYGSNTPIILDILEADMRHKLPIRQKILFAELQYAVNYEMVCTLSDFAIRRTGRLYFERDELDDIYFDILDELERLLKLSKQVKLAQLNEFEIEFEAVVAFKKTLTLQK
ncbi:MAG: glycerol-3-phosphate dehydrogenase/oxidase [Chitinophagales bacterium]